MKKHEEITGETSDESLINHGRRWLREKDVEIAELKAEIAELKEKQEEIEIYAIKSFADWHNENYIGISTGYIPNSRIGRYLQTLKK